MTIFATNAAGVYVPWIPLRKGSSLLVPTGMCSAVRLRSWETSGPHWCRWEAVYGPSYFRAIANLLTRYQVQVKT